MILFGGILMIQLRYPLVDLPPRTRKRWKHTWIAWTSTLLITRSVNESTNW
jgi:hypothetical protein